MNNEQKLRALIIVYVDISANQTKITEHIKRAREYFGEELVKKLAKQGYEVMWMPVNGDGRIEVLELDWKDYEARLKDDLKLNVLSQNPTLPGDL